MTVLPLERRSALLAKIGRELHPEVWELRMVGYRMLVVPEPAGETYKGLIHKPRSAQEREALEMGAGYVIAVGPLVGSDERANGLAGAVGLSHPADLLGARVLYRAYAGTNLRTNEEDAEFGGKFSLTVLTDRDILAWSPGV